MPLHYEVRMLLNPRSDQDRDLVGFLESIPKGKRTALIRSVLIAHFRAHAPAPLISSGETKQAFDNKTSSATSASANFGVAVTNIAPAIQSPPPLPASVFVLDPLRVTEKSVQDQDEEADSSLQQLIW